MTHTVHVERIKGITDILIIDLPGARSAYVTFNLYSGFRQAISEDRRLYHVPHLLEHMVFDGSQAYPSVEQLGAELSEGGTYRNASTSNHINQYELRCEPSRLTAVIPALMDMIYRPLLTEESFEQEREVVAREVEEQLSGYDWVVAQTNACQYLPDAMVPLLEQLEILNSLKFASISEYHKKYYTARNTAIIVAADLKKVTKKQILTILATEFETIPKGRRYRTKKVGVSQSPIAQYSIDTPPEIDTFHVAMSFIGRNAPSRDTLNYMRTFSEFIAAPESYSIYHYLRKQGLVYSIDASATQSIESSELSISFVCNKEQYYRLFSEVLIKLREYTSKPVDKDVLDRIKRNTKGALLIGCETPTEYEGWYEDWFLYGEELTTPEELSDDIMKISQRNIQQTMQPLIANKNLYMSVMGGRATEVEKGTEYLRQQILDEGRDDIEGLIKEAQVVGIQSGPTTPLRTWLTRLSLLAVAGAIYTPCIIDKTGNQISLWQLSINNEHIFATIYFVLVTAFALLSFTAQYKKIAAEVFWTLGTFYVIMWILVAGDANMDANTRGDVAEWAAGVLTLMPVLLCLATVRYAIGNFSGVGSMMRSVFSKRKENSM